MKITECTPSILDSLKMNTKTYLKQLNFYANRYIYIFFFLRLNVHRTGDKMASGVDDSRIACNEHSICCVVAFRTFQPFTNHLFNTITQS